MKNSTSSSIIIIVVIVLLVLFISWTNSNNEDVSETAFTARPFIATIEDKRIIPGNLYPLSEIEIKSPISGTLDKTFIHVGTRLQIGDPIAQIKLISDPSKIEIAKSNLNSARINFENETKAFERAKKLYQQDVTATAEYELAMKAYELSKEQFLTAQNQLALIQEGAIENSDVSNTVKSTASGTVIDLPLKRGASIIERNSFSNGTTIATIARLDTFIFKGKVSEVDLVHLRKGMKLKLKLNAYSDQMRIATLNMISAKGIEEQGTIKYYIEASFGLSNDSILIRSGYSANAEVILRKRENILAMKEKYLQFKNDSTFVNTLDSSGRETIKYIVTGLSDGINIEIVEGLTLKDRIKIVD